MKTISFLNTLCLVLLLTACNKDKKNTDVNIGDEFELDFDQTAFFNNGNSTIPIKFIEVLEDSRCPDDAICLWEGRVVIKLDIDEASVELATFNSMNGDSLQTAEIGNYLVKLIEIKPRRGSGDAPKDDEYSAVLEITKE